FDAGHGADAHTNGTIFAAALWAMRQALTEAGGTPIPRGDLLVVRMLLLLGDITGASRTETVQRRSDYHVALASLLRANQELYCGERGGLIEQIFAARGIRTEATHDSVAVVAGARRRHVRRVDPEAELDKLRQRVGPDEVPASVDLLSPDDLEARL